MPATPEVLRPEAKIQERQEEFIVPETLQQSTGVKVVQKNFTSQIKSDDGKQVVQTLPTQVITVQPPADDTTLVNWSKGDTTSALTWLGAFWIGIIKKALHFGWEIVGGKIKT